MLNVLYAGSTDTSAHILEQLLNASGEFCIAGVLTNPPAVRGRHKIPEETPVAQCARKAKCAVFEPEKIDETIRTAIHALKPDMLVCFAYGKIFGPKFLALFPCGAVNLHPSLLPKYRGASPVVAAILNRDTQTGITVQKIAPEMDSGDILLQRVIPLVGNETTGSLLGHTASVGTEMLIEVLQKTAEQGTILQGVKQNPAEVSYCALIHRMDGKIDWTKSAAEIDAKIRAFFPHPSAFTTGVSENKSGANSSDTWIKIHKAVIFQGLPTTSSGKMETENVENKVTPGTVIGIDDRAGILVKTGDGIIAIQSLQRAGKNALGWKDFMNGNNQFVGKILE